MVGKIAFGKATVSTCPPGVEHTFVNDGDVSLELIIVVELVPEGTEVESDTAIISNYRENDLTMGPLATDSSRRF